MNNMSLKLPGFNYENKVPAEDILAAKAWLDSLKTMELIGKEQPTKRWYNLGNFALVAGGKVTYNEMNWACHAHLSTTRAERSCVAFWCHAHAHDDWKPFINWLATDSFCSEYVVATADTGFVVSADIPAGVLHAIAMTSRVPRMFEQEYFLRWNKLVADGVHPGVAYQAVFNINKGSLDSVFSPSTDHRTFPCPGLSGMRNFISGKWSVGNISLFSSGIANSYCSKYLENTRYDKDIYRSLSFVDDLFDDAVFREILANHRRGGEPTVYTPPNPFKKPAGGIPAGCMTIKEVYEIALPYCMKEGIFNAT